MTEDEPNYEVGYGKPPEHSRFKSGQSGNPKGRPKGSLNFPHLFRRTAFEKIWVSQDNKRRQMTKLEAAMTQLVNKAVKGDVRATQLLLTLMPLLEDPAVATPGMTGEAEREAMQMLYVRVLATPTSQPLPTETTAIPTPASPPAKPAKGRPMPAKKSLPMKTTPALKKLQEMQND